MNAISQKAANWAAAERSLALNYLPLSDMHVVMTATLSNDPFLLQSVGMPFRIVTRAKSAFENQRI